MANQASEKFTFSGWSLAEFLKGRKKLLITLVGGVAAWLTTQDPLLTGIIATGTEFLYSIIEYYIKE